MHDIITYPLSFSLLISPSCFLWGTAWCCWVGSAFPRYIHGILFGRSYIYMFCRNSVVVYFPLGNSLSHTLHESVFCRIRVYIKMIRAQHRVLCGSTPVFPCCLHKRNPLTQNLRAIKWKRMETYITVLVCVTASPSSASLPPSGLCFRSFLHRAGRSQKST